MLFGLLLIVAVLLTMIHRVLPFFIEKAAQMAHGQTLTLPRFSRLQQANLVLFLLFTGLWLFMPDSLATVIVAWLLALLNGRVLWKWAHRVVFREPLLWSLWGGYAFIVAGFVLIGLPMLYADRLALHAWGVGGMGLTALGMMARVTLGHTGRNVFEPGRFITVLLLLVLTSALLRVFGPLALPYLHAYEAVIGISLVLWCLAFGLFALLYGRYWLRPRVDGRYG